MMLSSAIRLVYCCFASLMLIGCGHHSRPESSKPSSHADALLRHGLVAPQHARWLAFCDSTRLERFQLGKDLPAIWAWLATYYEQAEANEVPEPELVTRAPSGQPSLTDTALFPPPTESQIHFTSPHDQDVRRERSRRQAEALPLVNALYQAQLLPKPIYQAVLPFAQAKLFADREEVLTSFTAIYKEAQAIRQDTQLVTSLIRAGILSTNNARLLRQHLMAGQVLEAVDILPYLSSPNQIFTRSDYPESLGAYLLQIHQEAAQVAPGLSFTDFTYRVEIRPDVLPCAPYCPDERDAVVSLRIQGKSYQHRWRLWDDWTGTDYAIRSVNQHEFYEIFNHALADKQSPYRLVSIDSNLSKNVPRSSSKFGLWLLTPAQARILEASDKRFSKLCYGYEDYQHEVPKLVSD